MLRGIPTVINNKAKDSLPLFSCGPGRVFSSVYVFRREGRRHAYGVHLPCPAGPSQIVTCSLPSLFPHPWQSCCRSQRHLHHLTCMGSFLFLLGLGLGNPNCTAKVNITAGVLQGTVMTARLTASIIFRHICVLFH